MNKNKLTYFLKRGLTATETAVKLNVSRKAVTSWAKRYELSFPFRKGTPPVLNKSIVKVLLKRGFSNKEIAKIFKVKRTTVQTYRQRQNLYYKSEIPYYNKKQNISNYNKSLIIGTVLGDGYISPTGELTVGHSLKQKNYCKWKADKLNCIFRINKPRLDKRTNKTYYSCSFRSRRTKFNKKLREELYEPEKQITKKSLKYFSSLSLAILYMDDGFKTNGSYKIATNSFTKNSLRIFNQHCKKRFGIWFTIHTENKLYLPIKFKRIFEKIIKPYIHPELEYKMHCDI